MAAPLNLMKLCVGCKTPDELARWQERRYGSGHALHVTRMWPTREAEILEGGGSIYWVFKGVMLARQRLIGFQEQIGQDGIRRCGLMLDREMIHVSALPRRAFQGWRYLAAADCPADVPAGRATEPALPPRVAQALAEMGLI